LVLMSELACPQELPMLLMVLELLQKFSARKTRREPSLVGAAAFESKTRACGLNLRSSPAKWAKGQFAFSQRWPFATVGHGFVRWRSGFVLTSCSSCAKSHADPRLQAPFW
jgi:hypothetical protein